MQSLWHEIRDGEAPRNGQWRKGILTHVAKWTAEKMEFLELSERTAMEGFHAQAAMSLEGLQHPPEVKY